LNLFIVADFAEELDLAVKVGPDVRLEISLLGGFGVLAG